MFTGLESLVDGVTLQSRLRLVAVVTVISGIASVVCALCFERWAFTAAVVTFGGISGLFYLLHEKRVSYGAGRHYLLMVPLGIGYVVLMKVLI